MKDEWGKPIEVATPISIDSEGCLVVGRYYGAVEVSHRESERKSKIHSVILLEKIAFPNGEVLNQGDECRFWGSYDLDEKLRRVLEGEKIRIAYIGMEKLSGNREMKIFEVRVSKEKPRDYDEKNPPPAETPF